MATAAISFASTIDISTGVAGWQVFVPGSGLVAATSLTAAQQNGTWASAPAGSAWVSWSAVQGASCVVGQTPGNGCANTLINPAGDIWTYTLTITAASLGSTSGNLNFIFGADNRVNLFVGNSASGLVWNGGSNTNGTGFNPLGCSGTPPTSAGNTQATYNNCTGTVGFNPADLNGDGSLTLTAFTFNDPIPGCAACGNPTGFILEGDILTGASTSVPEPGSFGLMGAASLALFALRRIRRA